MDILNSAPFTGEGGGPVLVFCIAIIVVGAGLTIESVARIIGRYFGKQNTQPEVSDEDEEDEKLDEIKALLEEHNKLLGEIRDAVVKSEASPSRDETSDPAP